MAEKGRAGSSRLRAIRSSVRCFVLSLVGLLPIIGLPFSLAAMLESRHAVKNAGNDWNPARNYLLAGRGIAPLGLLVTFFFVVVVFLVLPAVWRDMADCSSGST